MKTPFLQYVSEARVVRRNADLQRYTFQEIQERIYLSFLSLSLLKNFNQTANWVKKYGNETLTYGAFDRVRTTANDLHNMLAVVDGDKSIVNKLSNKIQANALRQRSSLPTLAVKRYLRKFSDDYQFLTNLEKSLNITNSDYRNLRRAISDYKNIDGRRKQLTVTRLLQALRAKLPGTDIAKKAEEFGNKQKLEIDNVIDAERNVVNVPMTPEELTAYRIFVGPSNVRKAKMAFDMAKQGKGIAAHLASAYAPIMQMIDDVAKGGFTYVRLLKSIADRAKKSKK